MPTDVAIYSQRFYFKHVHIHRDSAKKKEDRTHEEIVSANFGPDFHTSLLYGIVLEEDHGAASWPTPVPHRNKR
ncbi:hypothetical protein PT974_06421 [Cladobotryum mycophilum]|uniref:Uncharacterized protein n=1 Tax=Cladobotryum mycophilum TaxID=491253 RepID=A0ABR0SLE4_9HYPO